MFRDAARPDPGPAHEQMMTNVTRPRRGVRLSTILGWNFQFAVGMTLLATLGGSLAVLFVPSVDQKGREGIGIGLVLVGAAAIRLAFLLSRRSARAITGPLELLHATLAAITAGDLDARVRLNGSAAEVHSVGESVNLMAVELGRLRALEDDRARSERVQRELAQVVYASLDLDQVAERAIKVVGAALDADRVHIQLLEQTNTRLVAEWRRSDDVTPIVPIATTESLSSLQRLIGVPEHNESENNDVVVIDDALDATRFSAEERTAFAKLGIRAAVNYPLAFGTRVAGSLVVSEERAPRRWSPGELVLMGAFAREIGRAVEHAKAFELRGEMVDRLEILDRAKSDFLSKVSHELRSPLTSVLGYLELIRERTAGALTDEQDRMLAVIARNGRRLLVLIEDLLTMSSVEAGTFDLRFTRVEFARVVERVRETTAPALAKGALELTVDLGADLELTGDPEQLERAVLNLVSNAVKFTPRGGRIDVAARSEDDWIVLTVRDTGIGIPTDEQHQLFTRFFRSRLARGRETPGTGLGLYIVKQIVEGHGGSVAAVSVPDQGSTFTVRLPVRPVEDGRAHRGGLQNEAARVEVTTR